MMRSSLRLVPLLAIACFLTGPVAAEDAKKPDPPATPAGHSLHGEVFNEGPRQKAYLMGGTGKLTLKVSTKAPEAQQFFDQGLGQLHGFWYF
jgi:hypothetical protein